MSGVGYQAGSPNGTQCMDGVLWEIKHETNKKTTQIKMFWPLLLIIIGQRNKIKNRSIGHQPGYKALPLALWVLYHHLGDGKIYRLGITTYSSFSNKSRLRMWDTTTQTLYDFFHKYEEQGSRFQNLWAEEKLVSFPSLCFQGRIAMGGWPHGEVWVPCT